MKILVAVSVCVSLLLIGCAPSAPVARWEYTGGPYAQNVTALLCDQSNPSGLLAGCANGQVFRSSDLGRSWSLVSTIRTDKSIHRFFQHPLTYNRFYAATDAGLFVSTNKGTEWSMVVIGSDMSGTGSVRALTFDPFKPQVLYSGVARGGLFKSTDDGATWTPCNAGLDSQIVASAEIHDIAVDGFAPDILYAAIAGIGVAKSTDAGRSWSKISEELATKGATATRILLNPRTSGMLCFATNTGNIYRSTNGGGSWSPTRRGETWDVIASFTPDPTNPDVLYAGAMQGMLVSTDFGASWKPLTDGLSHIPMMFTAASSRNTVTLHAYGPGIGVQRSADGGRTWMHEDTGLPAASVPLLATDKQGTKLCASVENALYYYKPESGAWVSITSGLTGGRITSVAFAPDSSSVLYASTLNGIYRTTNNGTTWGHIAKRLRFTEVHFLDVHPSISSRIFASGTEGLFISTDKGESWVQSRPVSEKYEVRSLSFTPTNAGVIHGSTVERGVISSDDGGFNWESTKYGLSADDVLAVTRDGSDEQTLYAWTSRGDGFRSINKGIVWDHYAPPWNAGENVLIAYDRFEPREVVALVNNKQVYYSPTGGATWFPLTITGELNQNAISLHWNTRKTTLYVGTMDGGVHRLFVGDLLKKIFDQ